MWHPFFKEDDEFVNDMCPVCKEFLAYNSLKTERVYFCKECDCVLMFHPLDRIPKMVKKKKTSNLDKNYVPYEEDYWMHLNQNPPEDQGKKS